MQWWEMRRWRSITLSDAVCKVSRDLWRYLVYEGVVFAAIYSDKETILVPVAEGGGFAQRDHSRCVVEHSLQCKAKVAGNLAAHQYAAICGSYHRAVSTENDPLKFGVVLASMGMSINAVRQQLVKLDW